MEGHGVKIGLLDYIATNSGCVFLSDLHEPKNLLSIKTTLHSIEPSLFRLDEWNDAVAYITGKDISFSTSEQALKYLLSYKAEKP